VSGHLDAVDPGHDNICQQQVVVSDLKRRQGFVAIAAGGHEMARTPKRISQKYP